jgi:DNA invertase Pin-like site-specific DNA recombinase
MTGEVRSTVTATVCLYARVSTHDQDPEVQLGALRAHAAQRGWQVAGEFVDRGISGAKERRPALDRLMKAAWAGQFQVVFVWRFDRFARSVKHLVAALETFRSLQVGFVSLQEQLDTATPIGQAMFTIIGAMAQLERDIIRERVKAGVERARARGIRLGRPTVTVDLARLHALRRQGLSMGEIARQAHCSRSTVRRRLRAATGMSMEGQAADPSAMDGGTVVTP